MNVKCDQLQKRLNERIQSNAFRILPKNNQNSFDFLSNDYLGLAKFDQGHFSEEIQSFYGGSTGSRLLSGNQQIHESFESYIATFFNVEAALLFNSGYDANIGLFSSLLQKRDVVLYDQLIHASIRDGISLSKGSSYKFEHNNIKALEKKLIFCQDKFDQIYVAVESIYSMDGDQADIKAMLELCHSYNALLIVDEAHGLGVMGQQAKGLVFELNLQAEVFATVYTFGKAVGAHGAVVVGSQLLKQFLTNFARSFIYTTALPPYSVKHIWHQFECHWKEKQENLHQNIKTFKKELKLLGLSDFFISSNSAIQSCIIPGNSKVKEIVNHLNHKNYNVKAVLSPTVEKGKERIRFCLHAYNTKEEICALLQLLYEKLEAY